MCAAHRQDPYPFFSSLFSRVWNEDASKMCVQKMTNSGFCSRWSGLFLMDQMKEAFFPEGQGGDGDLISLKTPF